jgi:hypothetical protein
LRIETIPPLLSLGTEKETRWTTSVQAGDTSIGVVSAKWRSTTGWVATMMLKLAVSGMHLLVVLFFTGLIGCALVVTVSWVSIFKEGFSDKK